MKFIALLFSILIVASCEFTAGSGQSLPPLMDNDVISDRDLLRGVAPHEVLDRIMRGPTYGLCDIDGRPRKDPEFEQVHRIMAWSGHPKGRDFTVSVLSQIDVHGDALIKLVPKDMKNYCPHFESFTHAQKRIFYASFFSILSSYESSFNPGTRYGESSGVTSRGLLQISNGSITPYGCRLAHEDHLHTPSKNFECGIKILTRLVSQNGVLASGSGSRSKGGARYWSPLRTSHKHNSPLKSRNRSACEKIKALY